MKFECYRDIHKSNLESRDFLEEIYRFFFFSNRDFTLTLWIRSPFHSYWSILLKFFRKLIIYPLNSNGTQHGTQNLPNPRIQSFLRGWAPLQSPPILLSPPLKSAIPLLHRRPVTTSWGCRNNTKNIRINLFLII